MATEEIALKITTDASQTEKSVKSIRQELREAQQSAIALGRQFGELSPEALAAAKKVATLKDEVGDLRNRIAALDPDAKFKAFSQSLQGVAGGFAGVQGAIGLFGTESKELEKQLLKVQSALALSEGLNSVLAAKDSFKTLGAIIKTNVVSSFSTLRGAIISTGIGALVVGIGLLIANFETVKKVVLNFIPGLAKVGEFISKLVDEITDFVGVTSEASRAYDKLARSTKAGNEDIDRRIALLKAQGGSEKEVAELSKRKAENELNVLRAKLKSEKKLNEEDLKQFKDLKNEKAIIDAQEQARLNELAIKRQEEARRRQEEANKKEEERRAGEIERLKGLEAIRVGITKTADDDLTKSKVSLLGTQMIAGDAAKLKEQEDAVAMVKFNEEIARLNKERKEKELDAYSKLSGDLADIMGRETAAGKAMAIAGATIDTYQAANKALDADYGIFGPVAQIARFIAVTATIARGIKNVKAIASVKTPSGGGGGAPSIPSGGGGAGGGALPTQAPIGAAVQLTNTQTIGTTDVNVQNQSAVKAFVVESDITDSQDRVSKIKAAATL
jgi:hypothetical protein